MIIRLAMADITKDQLNEECISVIEQFSQQLRRHNGTYLNTTEECVVKQMSLQVKISRCDTLELLYENFKQALMLHIESAEFDLPHTLQDELLQAVQNHHTT